MPLCVSALWASGACNVNDHASSPTPTDAASVDRFVTPERSLFGTRLPRPTGVGRHLIVVVVLSLAALAVAIGFAESRTDAAASDPAGRLGAGDS